MERRNNWYGANTSQMVTVIIKIVQAAKPPAEKINKSMVMKFYRLGGDHVASNSAFKKRVFVV